MWKIPEEKNVLLKSKMLHKMFFTPLYFQYTKKKKERKKRKDFISPILHRLTFPWGAVF